MSGTKFGKVGKMSSSLAMDAANSGFCDMQAIDISASAEEDIDVVAMLGGNVVVRGFKSTHSADGNLLLKTIEDDTGGYVTYPLGAGEKDIMLLPISHIKKTGSIPGVIAFYQKINQ